MDNLKQIAHNVYFTLKDKSPEAQQKLVEACQKYLNGHPGCVFFAAGILTDELDRPVNDREFQVALHVVFDSLESQNAYQVAPKHLQFIEENKEGWEKVRVFDSTVGS
ncbi:Dabb family protein [Blastopirellula marina]|uniref:Stress responsive protein n=1 Tax=Blastopirellula marina TaxID=124 RepID=A0A2S8GDD0_9BACT|nr:Dabb family protein [Blastopirellula marina]PQO42094.1 stress responsive protein [Blastopirellula marina]